MIFTKTKTLNVNVQECFDTWSMLNHRYIIINHFRTQANSVHDKDFKHILLSQLQALEHETLILEEHLERMNAKGPEPATKKVSAVTNSEVTKDKDVARIFHLVLKNEINKMVKIFRDTTTSNHLREFYLQMVDKFLNRFYDYEEYMKYKGWAESPPLYKYVPPKTNEHISTTEVYYLWEHYVYRTTNIHMTNILSKYVEDTDFKILLFAGLKVLDNQRNKLENLLIKYGVTLPEKYSNIFPTPEDPTIFEDTFIFKIIITGMQNAASLHGAALVDSLVNSEVRTLFKELVFSELDIINKMDKYGKAKGWVLTVPVFNMEENQ